MSDRIAVMHRGRIDQLADPRTLYDRPATAFALSFIGQSLALSGRVRESTGGMSMVETPAGPVRVPKSFTPGYEIIVATRPEHVRLGPGENTLTGTVTGVVFQGARSTVEIAAGGVKLSAELSGRETPPEPGAAVTFGWPLAETLAFPAEGVA